MLAKVTDGHIVRAKRMIGCGLDVEEVSQWLATHDADRAEITLLRTLERAIRRHFRGEISRTAVVRVLDKMPDPDKAKKPAGGATP